MSIILPKLPHFDGDDDPDIKHFNTRRITRAELRARDMEIARLVLEAAAKVADGFSPSERQSYIEYCPDAIRALEVRHHE